MIETLSFTGAETAATATDRYCRVAYQGGPGSFSEQAGLELLGDAFAGLSFPSFAQACAAVNCGADLAVLPVENSTTGAIRDALREIRRYGLETLMLHTLLVEHRLMAPLGATQASLRLVLGHPQVLQQCRGWIECCGIDAREVDDSALAAFRLAGSGHTHIGVLGSGRIAAHAGLELLSGPLQDRNDNRTTFALVGSAGVETPPLRTPGREQTEHAG